MDTSRAIIAVLLQRAGGLAVVEPHQLKEAEKLGLEIHPVKEGLKLTTAVARGEPPLQNKRGQST